MLEQRRVASGHETVSETLRALISDPSARLFSLFESGTQSFAQIVITTGLPAETVRAQYREFQRGFAAPPVVSTQIALENAKRERLEVRARILREQSESRERIRDRTEDAKTKRQEAMINAQKAHDSEQARQLRLAALSAPPPSRSKP